MGPLTDTQREKEMEVDGRREAGKGETGARWGKLVFSIYGQSCLQSQISSLQI